jgi:hypothetical protein
MVWRGARAAAIGQFPIGAFQLRCRRQGRTTVLEEYISDPPPLKWSDLRYVFDIQEDCNCKEAIVEDRPPVDNAGHEQRKGDQADHPRPAADRAQARRNSSCPALCRRFVLPSPRREYLAAKVALILPTPNSVELLGEDAEFERSMIRDATASGRRGAGRPAVASPHRRDACPAPPLQWDGVTVGPWRGRIRTSPWWWPIRT